VSDHRYHFPADRAAVWAAVTSVDRYRSWWPWLRQFRASGFAAGEVWDCAIQPPMPYQLRFTVTLEQVEAPSLVVATVGGDVHGTATLELRDAVAVAGGGTAPDGGMAGGSAVGCHVRLQSALAPANRTLRTVARLSRPLARYGHSWVIDTGATQFLARALADGAASATDPYTATPCGDRPLPGDDGEPWGDADQAINGG